MYASCRAHRFSLFSFGISNIAHVLRFYVIVKIARKKKSIDLPGEESYAMSCRKKKRLATRKIRQTLVNGKEVLGTWPLPACRYIFLWCRNVASIAGRGGVLKSLLPQDCLYSLRRFNEFDEV